VFFAKQEKEKEGEQKQGEKEEERKITFLVFLMAEKRRGRLRREDK
jgi:hypothetical protein